MAKRNRPRTLQLFIRLLKYWEVWIILVVLTAGIAIAAYQAPRRLPLSNLDLKDERELLQDLNQGSNKTNLINPMQRSMIQAPSIRQSLNSGINSSVTCPSNPQASILVQVNRQPEILALAASTNRGRREAVDRTPQKNPVLNTPQVIVLHETVIPLNETLRLFQTSTDNDSAQLSYHVLIGLNGDRYRVVPDEERAFGAGNSDFAVLGPNGRRQSIAVALNPNLPSSINNVALHVSLETPPDGNRETPNHSGYTEAQYASLAKVVGDWMTKYQLSSDRITTHREVDRDRTKKDPRSFNQAKFLNNLDSYLKLDSCKPS